MSKIMIWIVGAVVFVIVGGGLFFANQQSKQTEDAKVMQGKDAMVEKDDKTMGDDSLIQKSDDRYVEYSKAALDEAASNRRVLFFYANWCPICRPADADFSSNKNKIPSDVTVIRVNYNDPDTDQEEKDLAKKYGITYQHTFVQLDSTGKELSKWNGGDTDELVTNIK